MANQAELITRFDGGLNNRDSQKDLTEGFLSDVTNVDVSHIGTIKSIGKFVSTGFDNTIALTPDSFQTGVGLFTFRTDVGADSNDSAGEYIAYADGDGGVLFGSDVSSNTFNHQFNSSGHIHGADLGSDSNAKPVFYYADGGLRVADSDLSHTNNTALGLIPLKRVDADDPVYDADYDGYYDISTVLTAPVTGDFDGLASATDPDDDETNLGTPTNKIKIAVSANTAAGSQPSGLWAEGAYVVGVSYVYYGGQESKISDFLGHVDVSDGQYLLAAASIKDAQISGFIQGLRVYVKNFNDPEDEFTLLLDLDFERGSRISLGNEYDPLVETTGEWHTHDPLNGGSSERAYAIFNQSTTAYSDITGYDMEEHAISFQNTDYGYKTAVVANQRAFVANVRYPDTDGITKNMGDRIQYTPVRKYDTFPQTYWYDVATNDGDEIIKLEEFQDRLFIFKKNKLFILDISNPSDFEWRIIGEFNNRGVSNPGAVSKSDVGLVWANEYGLFAFSDKITKLSVPIDDKNGTDGWADKINADNVQVGYIPIKNQIVVIGTAATTSSAGYLYDITTSSFVNLTVNNALLGSTVTNFVRFEQQLCVMGSNGTLYRFDTTAAANRVFIKTKEFDFGFPSVDKKINAIYVTYQDANNVNLKYALNGAALDNSNGLSTIDREGTTSNALSDSSTRATHKFTFESATTCKSIQLLFTSGTNDTETDFEIEDITIVYRPRGLK